MGYFEPLHFQKLDRIHGILQDLIDPSFESFTAVNDSGRIWGVKVDIEAVDGGVGYASINRLFLQSCEIP